MRARGCLLLCLVFCLVLCLALPQPGQAANPLAQQKLKPAETLIAILDREGRLTSQGNRRLFKAAGFRLAVLDCAGGGETDCLRARLSELRERHAHILLMTSAAHTKTVAALYDDAGLRERVSGVIQFRARVRPPRPRGATLDDAPPLLLFAKVEDAKPALIASRRFADRLRRRGVWAWFYTLSDRTPASRVIEIISHFIGAREKRDTLNDFFTAHALWRQTPPFAHKGFFAHEAFINTYEVDDTLRAALRDFYEFDSGQLKKWEMARYTGFDLLRWREATGGGRWLTLRNHMGHFFALDLERYTPYEPVIVIGLDEVTNLFRLNFFYRTKAGYSWLGGEAPELSVRTLGAFLHFRKPLPPDLDVRLSIRSKLSFEGLSLTDENPLAMLDTLSPTLRKVVTRQNNCIYCHALGGTGGGAYHLTATTARPQKGFALPLRGYPKSALKEFFFNQPAVAAKIGAIPNPVPEEEAREMYDYLVGGGEELLEPEP